MVAKFGIQYSTILGDIFLIGQTNFSKGIADTVPIYSILNEESNFISKKNVLKKFACTANYLYHLYQAGKLEKAIKNGPKITT